MRYLPQLLCFEVKPNSVYPKMDYISLLVKASILNGYAEGTSNVSRRLLGARKGSRKIPTGETALSYFRGVDRYELQSAISIVLEDQVGELKRGGAPEEACPDSTGLARPALLRGEGFGDGAWSAVEERLVLRLPVPHREHPGRWNEADDRRDPDQEQRAHARLRR